MWNDGRKAEKAENTWPKLQHLLRYALALIDVRGTGGRGWRYRSPIYRSLGTVEVEDQVEAVQSVVASSSR